jgi:nucleoid DNA-binding protein
LLRLSSQLEQEGRYVAITKPILVKNLARRHQVSPEEARNVVDSFIDEIVTQLENGESVNIMGLGTFEPVARQETKRRNPRNGELLNVPPKKSVRFRISGLLKNRINAEDSA